MISKEDLKELSISVYWKVEHGNMHGAETIESIQLDAFKAGAEWAAERMKAKSMLYSSTGITRRAMNSCYGQIEFAASNLKEIPK